MRSPVPFENWQTLCVLAAVGVLGAVALIALGYDLGPAQFAVVAALALVRVANNAERLGDLSTHVATAVLGVALFVTFALRGELGHPLAGVSLGVALVGTGGAVWTHWSVDDDLMAPTHAFAATDRSPTKTDALAGAVRGVLAEGPRTRRELRAVVDADARAVDRSLAELCREGVVESAGQEFRLADAVTD